MKENKIYFTSWEIRTIRNMGCYFLKHVTIRDKKLYKKYSDLVNKLTLMIERGLI